MALVHSLPREPSAAHLADTAAPQPGDFDAPAGMPELVFCDEVDLSIHQFRHGLRHPPFGGRASIAAELDSARNARERIRVIRSMLHIIGFTCMTCVTLQLIDDEIVRAFFLNCGVPPDFFQSYFRDGFHRIDPRLAAVSSAGLPIIWDLGTLHDTLRRGADPVRGRALSATLDRHGMRSGLMFGMPLPRTNLHTVIGFSGPQPSGDWIGDSTIGQAMTLGLAIHQNTNDYVRALAQQNGTAMLSEMQQRILAGLAAGLSDKEIAQRLHTTSHNVDYHLRLLRKRYAVSNRAQLAYTAGRLGLV